MEVVPADDIERIEDAKVEDARLVHVRAVAVADRARGVNEPYLVAEERVAHLRLPARAAVGEHVLRVAYRMRRIPLPDLVRDGPQNHRRVAAVALRESDKVPRHVLLERLVIAPATVGVPLVERFVPNEDAHLVAKVEQFRRGRIVAGAERVRAHVLHDAQLPPRRRSVERHAEKSKVGMVVHALELHAPSVQVEAVRRPVVRVVRHGKRDGAHAEPHRLTRKRNALRILQRHLGVVERGIVHVPQTRILERNQQHALHGWRIGAGRVTRPRVTASKYLHLHPCAFRRILNLPRHLHEGALARHLGRGHEHAVVGEVRLGARLHHHTTVEARARIPPRRMVEGGGPYGKDVHAIPHERRRIHAEACVAVVPAPRPASVHVHLGRRHHAIEIKKHASRHVLRVQREPPAVPSRSLPRKAPGHA